MLKAVPLRALPADAHVIRSDQIRLRLSCDADLSQNQASLTFARASAFLAPAVMGLPPSPEPHAMAEAVPLRGLPAVVLVLLVMSVAQVWARGMPSARACPPLPMEA